MIREWKLLLLCGAITIAASLPFLWHLASIFGDPLYREVSVRGDFVLSHFVESPTRSGLIVAQFLFLLLLARSHRREWHYLASLSFLAGIVLAMHQNVLHGRILMFSSHYSPQLLLSALVGLAWALRHRAAIVPRLSVALIGVVFLFAAANDYLLVYNGFRFVVPRPFDFRDQHLVGAIALLDDDRRDVVLSDAVTGRLVTSWTDDGIVYTTHARFLKITDAEMAERYCVSEMFSENFPSPHRVLYMEYNDQLSSEDMRNRERDLVFEACTRVRADREAYLDKYGVTRVLWNLPEARTWSVDAEKFGLVEIGSGSGWTLWRRDASV